MLEHHCDVPGKMDCSTIPASFATKCGKVLRLMLARVSHKQNETHSSSIIPNPSAFVDYYKASDEKDLFSYTALLDTLNSERHEDMDCKFKKMILQSSKRPTMVPTNTKRGYYLMRLTSTRTPFEHIFFRTTRQYCVTKNWANIWRKARVHSTLRILAIPKGFFEKVYGSLAQGRTYLC